MAQWLPDCLCFAGPQGSCICGDAYFTKCAADSHKCTCNILGTQKCRAEHTHRCACRTPKDASACMADNAHACVCVCTNACCVWANCDHSRKIDACCRSDRHWTACYCNGKVKSDGPCKTRFQHRCICSLGLDMCYAKTHVCVCEYKRADACLAKGYHPCVCKSRGPAKCISNAKIYMCPCTCTTAGDNSACRAGSHTCTCRYVVSGTEQPSVDQSVCRVPPSGVHLYYTSAFCPPYTK
jgi:hypothetical protein